MDPGQILLVIAAVSVGFFAKGVTGIGGPVLAIPVLASFLGVEYAVAVIAIPTLLANTWLLWVYRTSAREVAWLLGPLLAAGGLGTVLGSWSLVHVDDRVLSIVLAVFLLAYIVGYGAHRELLLTRRAARRLSGPVGLVGGWLQGATGISAPVIATYVHSLRLERTTFIVAVTVPFQVLGAVQVGSLAAFGGYDRERLTAALLASIPVVIVFPLAMRLGRRLTQPAFQVAVLLVLGAAAVRLLWSALG